MQGNIKQNYVSISGDDYREYHPRFKEINLEHGREASKYTQQWAAEITEKLIRELRKEKYNLIIEGTLRTAELPLKEASAFKKAGYEVELNVVVVKAEKSRLGTLERYETMLKQDKTPRMTPKEHHDLVVNNIGNNLEIIYNSKAFDNIKLFDRGNNLLYNFKENPDINPKDILKETLGKKKLKKKNQEDLEEIKMIYGYVRVSSKTQNEERQVAALKNSGVAIENIFIDKESGKDFNRNAWQKLMAKLVIGDVIVIKELDRMGRNNNEIKENFELIKNKGCYLEFLENPLLSTKGKSQVEIELIQPLVLHLFGYLAEKEREKLLIRQREAYEQLETDEKGRKISKKKNKVVGRPNKLENLTTEQKRYIRAWIDGFIKITDCIKNVGIKKTSLYKIKKTFLRED